MPDDPLSLAFGALADPTRRAILARLAAGEASVATRAEPFAMSSPAISKHLKVLERAGLVEVGRSAQSRPRRLVAKPLAEATEWLGDYPPVLGGALRPVGAAPPPPPPTPTRARPKGRARDDAHPGPQTHALSAEERP